MHNCTKQHRNYQTMAMCMFPRNAWIIGEGPYMSIAFCGSITIMLFTDPAEALKAKTEIDDTQCGGRCSGRHEVIQIELRKALRWTSTAA